LSFDPTKVAMLAELPSADVAHCGCDVPDATPAPAQVGTCQVSDDGADCGCD
jgi:hypothetical protein